VFFVAGAFACRICGNAFALVPTSIQVFKRAAHSGYMGYGLRDLIIVEY
jgi:hypothetical protein